MSDDKKKPTQDEINEEAHALLGVSGMAMDGLFTGMSGVLNEAYLAHIDAGFTQRQALWLIGCMVVQTPGTPPEGVSE